MNTRLFYGLVVAAGVFAASAMALDGGLRTEGGADAVSVARLADAAKQDVPHTVTWWCVDLNEVWHVDVQLLAGAGVLTPPDPSPLPPCPSTSTFPIAVPAGSPWAVGNDWWFTNHTYPPAVAEALGTIGYRFASNSPMEDLTQKLVEVRYVVVTFPGNVLVAEFSFDPRQTFRLVREAQLSHPDAAGPIVNPDLGIDISADAVGRLPLIGFPKAVAGGLPPGSYRALVYWVLSDLHNDGLGLDDGNFLPAGEVLYVQPRFIVVP